MKHYILFFILITLSFISSIPYHIEDIDCLATPWDPSCSNFHLNNSLVTTLNVVMCGSMYMSGCTVNNICNLKSYLGIYPQYCLPFSIYKELCTEMPGMDNCTQYTHLCLKNTSVIDCNMTVLPLLKGKNYKALIDDICSKMDMDGCDTCQMDSKCDKLAVYSKLCLQMPEMDQCDAWKNICGLVPNWPICKDNVVPSMKMYFHTGINEYILFQDIVPTTVGQYVIVLIVLFLASIGFELLKFWRTRVTANYLGRSEVNLSLINDKNTKASTSKSAYVLKTSTLYFVEITLGFLLMLLIMTFNVLICISIVVGRYAGALICGFLDDSTPLSKEVDCH